MRAKSDQDPDPHRFNFLDSDPDLHLGKKLDPEANANVWNFIA
jgi:hypothetical protein